MPSRKFWNPRLLRCIFLHFEVYFYFSLLFLGVNQFEQIWRKKNCTSTQIDSRKMHYLSTKKKEHDIKVWPQLAISMSSTNVGKNRYRSISLILMLEQHILIMITSWQPLVFILSPSFLSIPATALHILHFVITRRFNWALLHLLRSKGGIHARMSFFFTLAFVSYNTGFIFAKSFSKHT